MKRSIPNIGFSLFFIFNIPFWGWVCSIFIRKMIFDTIDWGDIVAVIFLGMMLIYLCYWPIFKFQLVKIDTKGIYAFYPFLNKRKQILWEDFRNITADVINSRDRLPAYRKMTLKGKKGRERIVKISLNDREFENFNALTDAIPIPKAKTLRMKIDIKQAKEEKYMVLTDTVIFGVGVLWLLYELFVVEKKLTIIVFVLFLLFSFICIQCTRKLLWFYKVLKMNKKG
ncbi:MAG: hypothetical protein KGV44_07330 [Flavobacteriaceae bacterium]|nr:hypothetical protein [Flavobacteriaceae bacterium]